MLNLLRNPILLREFRGAARDGRTLLFLAVLLGGLGLIILALWPRTGIFSESHSTELFTVFLGAQLTFMILLTPGFTASAITSERERNSFDLLQTSLLTPAEILSGKLVGSLGMPFLLLLASLPVTVICALSGGISLPTLLRALAIIAAATFTYGLVGLAASALCKRSYAALLATYLAVAALAGAVWLPGVLMTGVSPGVEGIFLKLRALSPYEALFAQQYAERYELTVAGSRARDVFMFHLGGMGVVAAVAFSLFARFVLRPPRGRRNETRQMYDDTRTLIKRKLGFPFYLIDPLRRRRPIANWRNPVFVAELRSKIFGNPKFIVRALSVCIMISIGLLLLVARQYATTIDADRIRSAAIIFQLGVIALLAPAVGSSSITDEKTSGTLLLLRLTPISPARVVAGKLKASLMYVGIFLISSLPVFFSLAYLESQASYWRIGAWLGVLVTTSVVLTAGGLCASTFAPSTGAATAWSYGFALIACAGPLTVFLFGARVGPELQTFILTFNPFVAALEITSDQLFSGLPSLWGRRLWENHLIAYGALAALLLTVSAARVHRLFRERG